MRAPTPSSTDGMAILAGAREAAGRVDSVIPAEAMARFNEWASGGALDALPPAAAWAEIEAALAAPAPWRFVEVLRDCGALGRLLPELDALFGVPQPFARHPEVDAGVHGLLTLRRAAERTEDPALRLAALLHDIGKAATPRAQWPMHDDHGRLGTRLIERIGARLRMPQRFRDLAILAARHHGAAEHVESMSVAQAATLFAAIGTSARLDALVLVCDADHRGRRGFEAAAFPQADLLRAAFARAS